MAERPSSPLDQAELEKSSSRSSDLRSPVNNTRSLSDRLEAELGEPSADEQNSFVSSKIFSRFITTVIIINSLQMGVCIHRGRHDDICSWVALMFNVIFFLEMLLKLHHQKRSYFRQSWNIFDFVLVLLSIIDYVIQVATDSCKPCEQVIAFRLIRLLRVVRLFRVLRTRRELAVLAEGLLSSIKSMIWIFFLLTVFIYAGSIFCMGAFRGRDHEFEWEKDYFKNLFSAMLTLFSLTILDNWDAVVIPVAEHDPIGFVIFFLPFVFVASFGVLNLVIGIIAESTAKASAAHEALLEKLTRKEMMERISLSVDKIYAADGDGDAKLTPEELQNSDWEAARNLLEDIDLPPGFHIADLHLMVSPDMEISKKTFLRSMERISFCNEFQRDCLTQHSINDIRRRLAAIEPTIQDLKKFLSAQKDHHAASDNPTRAMTPCSERQTPREEGTSQSNHQTPQGKGHEAIEVECAKIASSPAEKLTSLGQDVYPSESLFLMESRLKADFRTMMQELQTNALACQKETSTPAKNDVEFFDSLRMMESRLVAELNARTRDLQSELRASRTKNRTAYTNAQKLEGSTADAFSSAQANFEQGSGATPWRNRILEQLMQGSQGQSTRGDSHLYVSTGQV